MKPSRYKQETVITYNEEESAAKVYTYNRQLQNRLAAFAEESDNCCLVSKDEDCTTYTLPKKWVKVSMPQQNPKEQRQIMNDTEWLIEHLKRRNDERNESEGTE